MARYFLELAYLGTNFHGWQRQPNGVSVQQVLEEGLSTLLQQEVAVTGAGRTDAGVHARYMVAHFDWDRPFMSMQKLVQKLNRFLPRDIVVYSVSEVAPDAHSRFDAVARRYEYHASTVKDPFSQQLATRLRFPVDVTRMNEAAALLPQCSDFTSFSKLGGNNKTNICKVQEAYWEERGSLLVFHIEADRFLRNMVRALVGTLLDVGRGKLRVEDFAAIIKACDRSAAGTSAPAEGLYLVDVRYPEAVFKRSVS